jgi:hypothetical protein
MRRVIIVLTTFGVLAGFGATPALAAANPSGTGQPSQSCGSATAFLAPPGFSTAGFANAEQHYANPGSMGGLHSGNSHVVAQYDVACYQHTQNAH